MEVTAAPGGATAAPDATAATGGRLLTLPSFEVMKRAYDVVVAGLVEREDLTYADKLEAIERMKVGLDDAGYGHSKYMELIDFREGLCCFCADQCSSQCCGRCARQMGILAFRPDAHRPRVSNSPPRIPSGPVSGSYYPTGGRRLPCMPKKPKRNRPRPSAVRLGRPRRIWLI